eukprot:6131133-Alexandrium_andersonii.AAC.1
MAASARLVRRGAFRVSVGPRGAPSLRQRRLAGARAGAAESCAGLAPRAQSSPGELQPEGPAGGVGEILLGGGTSSDGGDEATRAPQR